MGSFSAGAEGSAWPVAFLLPRFLPTASCQPFRRILPGLPLLRCCLKGLFSLRSMWNVTWTAAAEGRSLLGAGLLLGLLQLEHLHSAPAPPPSRHRPTRHRLAQLRYGALAGTAPRSTCCAPLPRPPARPSPPTPARPPARPRAPRTFFTIFCSSTRKARMMRSFTTAWLRWPPYARCTVLFFLLRRESSLGRRAGSCVHTRAGTVSALVPAAPTATRPSTLFFCAPRQPAGPLPAGLSVLLRQHAPR